MVFTIIMVLVQMYSYSEVHRWIVCFIGIISILLCIVQCVIKIAGSDGLDALLEESGITDELRFLIYIILAILLLAGIAIIMLIGNIKVLIIGIILYSVFAVAGTVFYSIAAED